MSHFYPAIESWVVPLQGWRLAFDEMAQDGRLGNEGTCLWVGSRHGKTAIITDVVVLRGEGIRKHPELITISDDLMHKLANKIAGSARCVIGQIHSHGIGSSTALSQTDQQYTMRVPGFLSIVAPDYAQRLVDPEYCGVHVFESGLGFRRMDRREARCKLRLDPKQICGLISIGDA